MEYAPNLLIALSVLMDLGAFQVLIGLVLPVLAIKLAFLLSALFGSVKNYAAIR